MEAVRSNGVALEYTARELRRVRQTFLEAVRQNGVALQHASAELRMKIKRELDEKEHMQQAEYDEMARPMGARERVPRIHTRRLCMVNKSKHMLFEPSTRRSETILVKGT